MLIERHEGKTSMALNSALRDEVLFFTLLGLRAAARDAADFEAPGLAAGIQGAAPEAPELAGFSRPRVEASTGRVLTERRRV